MRPHRHVLRGLPLTGLKPVEATPKLAAPKRTKSAPPPARRPRCRDCGGPPMPGETRCFSCGAE